MLVQSESRCICSAVFTGEEIRLNEEIKRHFQFIQRERGRIEVIKKLSRYQISR